jgi:inorganic triphosphatase YgiF
MPQIAAAAVDSQEAALRGTEAAGSVTQAAVPVSTAERSTLFKAKLPAVSRHAVTELRLVAEPDAIDRLRVAPPIVAHARNKGTVRLIKATYYDTPSSGLHGAGLTLKVCRTGKRLIQVLRVEPQISGVPRDGGEWQVAVVADAPDLSSIEPLLPKELQDVLTAEPLQPVFTTEVRRHRQSVVLPVGEVDVAFERGIIAAQGKTARFGEVGLKLKSGNPALLYDLALALGEFGHIGPSAHGSVDRGFELAFDTSPQVHKSDPPLSATDLSIDDAFAAILKSSLVGVLANQAAAGDGRDPEGVHQLRVALRRLRCALGMLKPLAPSPVLESFRADAKWLASALNEARNWDVFIYETLPEVAVGCGNPESFDLVRAAAGHARAISYEGARGALADRRCGRFQLTLGAWIEQRGWRCDVSGDKLATLAAPAGPFAARLLARRHGKLIKRGRNFKQLSTEQRHELRLGLKKLRYAADFFLPLFGSHAASKRYARRLSQLQERLGRYNDAATTRGLLARLPVADIPAGAREAIGAVAGWQACRLACTEPDLQSAWRDFRRAAHPWSATGES